MIEQQVNVKITLAQLKMNLPSYKSKTCAEFKQEFMNYLGFVVWPSFLFWVIRFLRSDKNTV